MATHLEIREFGESLGEGGGRGDFDEKVREESGGGES